MSLGTGLISVGENTIEQYAASMFIHMNRVALEFQTFPQYKNQVQLPKYHVYNLPAKRSREIEEISVISGCY